MGASNQRLFVPCLPTDDSDPCALSPVVGVPFSGPCVPADNVTFSVTARISASLATGSRTQDRTVDVTNTGGALTLANDTVVDDMSTGDGDVRLALAWDVSDGTLRAAIAVIHPTAMESLAAAAELQWIDS